MSVGDAIGKRRQHSLDVTSHQTEQNKQKVSEDLTVRQK